MLQFVWMLQIQQLKEVNHMRKTYKSLSALFLALCMVLTWMVPAAFAEESQTEEWTPLVESVVVAEDVIQSVERIYR